jgi:threonine dehydrogenase-like Zn-dependent dehydrogenase
VRFPEFQGHHTNQACYKSGIMSQNNSIQDNARSRVELINAPVFAPTEPGVSVPISVEDLFWRNEIALTSSYGGSPGDYAAALEFIQGGKIRVREMIIHRLGPDFLRTAFELLQKTHLPHVLCRNAAGL